MTDAAAEPGSFRDNRGRIVYVGDRVFRTVMPAGIEDFEFVRSTGLVEQLIREGRLIGESPADKAEIGMAGDGAVRVVEHPRLPFISYPYEWPFEALRAAALAHLELQQRALVKGVSLSDATAYNMQFRGARPVFIDSLSLRRYRDGEFWAGHRQFCEQFINPLLLQSSLGVPYQAWYRGSLEGIPTRELSRLLPWRSRLSWNTLTHVFMQARLQRSSGDNEQAAARLRGAALPRVGFEEILHSLHRWISRMKPGSGEVTTWQDYARDNSYDIDEAARKRAFVAEFAGAVRPALVFDIGCNTGDYSIVALQAGARRAVGFDADHGALNGAYLRARDENHDFLPLFLDAANPSPSQGWMEAERQGAAARAQGDGVLALAVVHHLAIARNLPLDGVLDWIIGMAPRGVIEFVPKADAMVKRLLALREDIFADYDEGHFSALLSARARVVRSETVSAGGRKLFWFDRS